MLYCWSVLYCMTAMKLQHAHSFQLFPCLQFSMPIQHCIYDSSLLHQLGEAYIGTVYHHIFSAG